MAEDPGKGFKIVDKRGMSDEEREKLAPPPPAAPPQASAPEGPRNQTGAPGVKEESGRREGGAVGPPTFLDLVSSLQVGALANLGLVQSPDGARTPVHLPAAKDSIDLLEVLHEKTKGNLTEEEAAVLSEGLYHLRMAYMAAVNAGQKAPGGKSK